VSKGVRWERVKEALDAGQRDFGENYLQEAIPKIEQLGSVSPRWHFIGQLQSNKAARIARAFDLVHSLGSTSAARALSGAATAAGKVTPVMIQVRLGGGADRGGVAPEAVEALAEAICELPGLMLDGVMGIAPLGDAARPAFARLRGILDHLRGLGFPNAPLRELSAGMSADYGEAILEGATFIRIGSAIFGERAP
jgi:pyridoxal phosphate enzyme (YggS family)